MTIRARQGASDNLRRFAGRKLQRLADLDLKTRNNYFAPLVISLMNSYQILVLRRSSFLASTKVQHYMGNLPYNNSRSLKPGTGHNDHLRTYTQPYARWMSKKKLLFHNAQRRPSLFEWESTCTCLSLVVGGPHLSHCSWSLLLHHVPASSYT